ncbi:MAG: LPS export ABC transporter permease LptF, partial [Rickettsiales bacterium]|nr:LPS export ABC transporter permease LptF [Rickettsiales bacterium]
MTLYNRYIIKNLVTPTLVFTFTLTGIIWLTQSLRFVDLIVNKGLSFIDFFYLSSLIVPSLLLIILPVSLFTTILFAYNKLIIESELIVLRGAGLNQFALAKPAIIVACMVTVLSYIISLYLLPSSYRQFKDKQAFIRDNYASLLLQEGVFNSPVNGLTIYLDKRDFNGKLTGILVHDTRDPDHPVTMMAEEGRLVKDQDGKHQFDLINGNRQEINHRDGQLSLLNFDRYTLDINQYTKTTPIIRWREPQERYMHELLNPEPGTPENLIQKLKAEAHQRITWPMYNIVLSLLALSALLCGQLNR